MTRWVLLGAALPVLWACNARTLEEPKSMPVRVFNNVYQATLNRKIDIVFMIDNSASMKPLQDKLLTNFPAFMDVLKGLEGGLPDVHIGIISSSSGAGLLDNPLGQCPLGGDGAVFHNVPRSPCTTNPFTDPNTQFYLQANGASQNFTGDISAAFTCIAALGETGCGFEGVFGAVRKALSGGQFENQGFLRPEAYLAVILITNEDDCSVPDDSGLIDPNQRYVSDPLGPYASFRCNEFGHLCNINGTMQHPPRTMAMANIQGCTSAEDGVLLRVADEVAFLKGLKPDPSKVLVAAIAGPTPATSATAQYSVEMVSKDVNGTVEDQPVMAHSCMQASGEYADPSVRIYEWVLGFGGRGLFLPICAPSFAPALMTIATEIGRVLGPACITGDLVDPPECQVNDRFLDSTGHAVETPIQSCAKNGGAHPCWELRVPAAGENCTGRVLNVMRDGMPPDGLDVSVACAICIPGVDRPGC